MLGPTRVVRDGELLDLGPAGRRAVFGLLALAHGQPLARRELVDALWGENPPATSVNIIQTHVKHLRQLLEPTRPARTPSVQLPSVGDGYALRLPAGAVDLDRFRQLVAQAAEAERQGNLTQAAQLLGKAFGLWQGLALADIPVLANHPRVLGLNGERRAALARYAEAMTATGQAAQVLPVLAEEAAAHPLNEAAQALLVRAYVAAGHRDRAFTIYDAARRRLADELGVGPGPDLTAAYLDLIEEMPAPAANSPSVVNQLPGDVFGFTGRRTEFAILDALVAAGEQTAMRIAVICGTAGVGKTALAVRWAHRVRGLFPDGQIHVDLRGYDPQRPVSAGEALARLLEALGVSAVDIPLDLDRRAARYRAAVADLRLLVVLDNASSADQIRPLLPGTPTCLTLITSRNSMAGLVALHGARRLDVDLLPADDATGLLHTLIGERVARDPAAAIDLAEQCARLPLALRVAAELAAARPASPLADLTRELADRQRRLRLLDPGDDVRAAVRTVFSWSYQHLRPEAALAFRRLGLHPGPDVDACSMAVLTGAGLDAAREALDTLARNHLVQPAPGERFTVHDLLRAYAADLAGEHDPPEERSAAVNRLFDHYLGIASATMDTLFPADRPYRPRVELATTPAAPVTGAASARAWLSAERPTLVALCLYAVENDRPGFAADLAATLYRYLESGHYTDALTVHSAALRAAGLTGNDAMQAHALTNLGAVHRLLGDYGPAAGHLRHAIELHRRTGDRYGAARAMTNLGIVEERLGQYQTAVAHHHEALAAHRALGNRYGEAAALLNLGAALSNASTASTQRSQSQAAEHLASALELFRGLGDRVGEASALSNLGDVCVNLGRYTDAIGYLIEARDLFHAINHRYGEAAALSNLGRVYAQLGEGDRAVEQLRTALEIFRRIGHRYGEASALNGLGETLRLAGREAEALEAHTAAFEIATGTGDHDESSRAGLGMQRIRQGAVKTPAG
ncbi:XRE family transcriptional regulator [Rhizocola hellebori]|uniref:XRE family transcriptional regulator n=1 Tax=Rhizocola hellebori TaxID=1392758 RepID=A0A8J3VC33_9ACTN|nr:XRE family transcriptional regulator [Rhizocola hellebori]